MGQAHDALMTPMTSFYKDSIGDSKDSIGDSIAMIHTWGCSHCVKLHSVEWTYETEQGYNV